MNCTTCKEPMIVLELEEVEIDHCISCGGTWLDAGELELLLEETDNKDQILDSIESDKKSKEKKRKCPICLKKMEKVQCGTDEKITLDRCKKNDGIWFDKGELRAVLKMSEGEGESRVLKLLKDMFASYN